MTTLAEIEVCATSDHERRKRVDAWWRDQPLIGFTVLEDDVLAQRNCRLCNSTLCRRCSRAEMVMEEAPNGYWTTALGYVQLADDIERSMGLEFETYFRQRAIAACEARFEEACARAAAGVPVAVPVVDTTEELATPNPWLDQRAVRT